MPLILNDIIEERLREMWLRGESGEKIARELNIDLNLVYAYARVRGLPPRVKTTRKIEDRVLSEIRELREKGLKVREIASMLNINPKTLYFYLKAMGLVKSVKRQECPEIPAHDILTMRDIDVVAKYGVSLSCLRKLKIAYGINKKEIRKKNWENKIEIWKA